MSERETRQRLKDDFEFYARNCLVIRPKEGDKAPFILNKAQKYIHEKIEEQLKSLGMVRAIILKGRQQGVSTYAQGRFNWKVVHRKGIRAYILTHEEAASQSLFTIGKRFYDNLPPYVTPTVSYSNAKELLFDTLDSGYKVGTAGNKAVGRSQTNQFFHGSETGYWMNAGFHARGILQTVARTPQSEVIYESTANGLGNFFHQQWKLAEAGEGDFIAIFVPWFWQNEYRVKVKDDFVLTDKEIKLKKHYPLDNEQINFRRYKIVELSADGRDGEKSFQQEYPMNASEAFQVSGEDGLIKADCVVRARNNKANPSGAYVVGVDPSRGGDRFSIVKRMGRRSWGNESRIGAAVDKLGKAVAWCKRLLDEVDPIAGKKPDMMFIDAGGGSEIVDRLCELGYHERVQAVAFGSTPLAPEKYTNKRGEMWGLANAWLNDENLDVQIDDSDTLQADLCASPYDRDSHDRVYLLKKAKIKKEYGFSPDEGDALALTFAFPVNLEMNQEIDYAGWS